MKQYELIIERQQPPCGGKPARLYEFKNVETDDPVAYVREHDQEVSENSELDIDDNHNGVITISFTSGVQPVQYEFTEE